MMESDIEDLKRRNRVLENRVEALERALNTANVRVQWLSEELTAQKERIAKQGIEIVELHQQIGAA